MSGAQVVREIDVPWDRNKMPVVEFVLNHSDYTMADRIAEAINTDFAQEIAEPQSASSVTIQVPEAYQGKFQTLMFDDEEPLSAIGNNDTIVV